MNELKCSWNEYAVVVRILYDSNADAMDGERFAVCR